MELRKKKVKCQLYSKNIRMKYLKELYSLDEINYSLVLEYADSGTLGEYLKNNATTFRWESQLKFANDISSAILCLHNNEIVHRDLVSLINYTVYFIMYFYYIINVNTFFYLAS